MNTDIFIDGKKLFKITTIVACGFLLLIVFGVFVFIKFDFFLSFLSLVKFPFINMSSIFKISFFTAYVVFLTKMAQSLIAQYGLILQKKPLMQISDIGLLFNQGNKVIFVPWNQVIGVRLVSISSGLIIDVTKEVNIENQPPFTKLESCVAVTISYPKISAETVYALVLEYKDQFMKC